jgi:hypothetical protein
MYSYFVGATKICNVHPVNLFQVSLLYLAICFLNFVADQ